MCKVPKRGNRRARRWVDLPCPALAGKITSSMRHWFLAAVFRLLVLSSAFAPLGEALDAMGGHAAQQELLALAGAAADAEPASAKLPDTAPVAGVSGDRGAEFPADVADLMGFAPARSSLPTRAPGLLVQPPSRFVDVTLAGPLRPPDHQPPSRA